MNTGRIARWHKKEGDAVAPGDVLAEIETDKATVDFTHTEECVLARILVKEGVEGVPVGAPLAVVVEDKADLAEVQKMDFSAAASGATTPAAPPPAGVHTHTPTHTAAAAAATPAEGGHGGSDVAAAVSALPATAVMPSARALMAAHGVHPSSLSSSGTGKGGRITKGDVLAYLGHAPAAAPATAPAAAQAAPALKAAVTSAASAAAAAAPVSAPSAFSPLSLPAAPEPRGKFTDTKPSQVRRVIAQRLTESKARIPHQYAVMDCKLDAMLQLRGQLKAAGFNLSVNDMIIKAAAKALREVPEANCFYDPKSDSVKPNATVDVSVAVATEGGLITPIVKGADTLGLQAINEKVKDLAGRARTNKLKPEEFQGGSFTISNLGMFGIDEFTAVINPPQAAILAVGRGEKKVLGAPITSAADLDADPSSLPEPTVATIMTVQMSSDARVLDAATAAQFLQVFRHYIQNPVLLNA